ncbi:MAG: hypothetical protein OEX00_11580 [Gammaproteobacteria bacterium]|nr:hypothetical protein [Gammaproteobacteria bacterium]MDH5694256.1 hypothetical protein [Gammaproteobacteria bacterium]
MKVELPDFFRLGFGLVEATHHKLLLDIFDPSILGASANAGNNQLDTDQEGTARSSTNLIDTNYIPLN